MKNRSRNRTAKSRTPMVVEANCAVPPGHPEHVSERPMEALEREEHAQRQRDHAGNLKGQRVVAKRRDADLKLLRKKAEEDPIFAALLRHLGVDEEQEGQPGN